MRIRQGDLVQVISGADAGPAAHKVVKVLDSGAKLMVEGVNRAYKHVRRGHPKSPQGGRLEVERPIDSSNVLLYCEACSRGVRVGFRYNDDGSKDRFCRKCGGSLGNVAPAKASRAKS